jgi:uncharacterized membrane protein YdcZ (DUF606 family)
VRGRQEDFNPSKDNPSNLWGDTDWKTAICLVLTVLSVMSVPLLARRYLRSLRTLSDPHLPEEERALGPVGLCLAIFGAVDFVLDISLCVTLARCGRSVLLCCSISTLVATTSLTWYLGYKTLQHIVTTDTRASSPAKRWLAGHPRLGPAIVFISSSRLNSMAILRLRLCGTMVISFPDSADHRFFHFLRNAGMFHYWLEDIPHALVSITLLSLDHCDENDVLGPLPIGSQDIAWASLACSLGSMLFGVISKMMQLLTMAAITTTNEGAQNDRPTMRTSVADAFAKLASSGYDVDSLKLSSKKEALLASKRHAQEAGGDDGEAAMIGGSE